MLLSYTLFTRALPMTVSYEILALHLRLFIRQCGIVKRRIPRLMRLTIEVVRQLLRDVA